MKRATIAMAVILVVGIPLIGAIYYLDRTANAGPSLVEQRVAQYEDAVRKSPNSLDDRMLLAGAYMADQRYSDALAQLNEVIKADATRQNAFVARGDVYLQLKDLPSAASNYQAVVDMMKGQEMAGVDTDLEAAYYGLAEVAMAGSQPAEAVPQLNAALAIDRTNADTLNLLGQAYVALSQWDKAIANLTQAVEFVPTGWADPYASLAIAYRAKGDQAHGSWAAAMADFANGKPETAKTELTALTSGPASTQAWLGLGFIAENQGDTAVAIASYRKVLAADPQNFDAQEGLSRLGGTSSSSPAASSAASPSGSN